jgi:hypothetical protein
MFIVVVLVNTLYISDIFYYIILGKQKSYPGLIHFFQGPREQPTRNQVWADLRHVHCCFSIGGPLVPPSSKFPMQTETSAKRLLEMLTFLVTLSHHPDTCCVFRVEFYLKAII